MAITALKFTRVLPVITTDGRAWLNITDLDGLPTNVDGIIEAQGNDGGSIVAVSIEPPLTVADTAQPWQLMAFPIATGVTSVTITVTEAGTVQTGTVTVTVSTVNGRLNAAWSTGTLTVN